ncbi:MAG: hypothetical protein ACRBDL_10145 [Alphaproteobacteria bacterium]
MFFLTCTALCIWSAYPDRAYASEQSSIWSPVKVDWQVVRTKNKKTSKHMCAIRWIYDKSTVLSFLQDQETFRFELHTPSKKSVGNGIPTFVTGQDYYGVLTKRNDSLDQMQAVAKSENILSLAIAQPEYMTQYYRTSERLSIFFENTIVNLPLTNALENFDAFDKCLETIKPKEDKTAEVKDVKEATPKTLSEIATNNMDVARKDLSIPPSLPAFKRSNTKKSVLEEYNRLDENDNYKEVNQNLLRKLRILENEKEELRKKLLSLTKESFIPGLVACEPSAGHEQDDGLSEIMEDNYKATIEQLRQDNRELAAQLDEYINSFP